MSKRTAEINLYIYPVYFQQFAKFPIERSVNETSFKLLSSFLNIMIDDKTLPRPIEATFYLKPHVLKKVTSFRKIRVTLRDVVRVRDAVIVILKSAQLPTSYVDSLPDEGVHEELLEQLYIQAIVKAKYKCINFNFSITVNFTYKRKLLDYDVLNESKILSAFLKFEGFTFLS